MSWVNQHLVRKDEVAPFGGVKSSGLGSEGGGAIGLKEFVRCEKSVRKKVKERSVSKIWLYSLPVGFSPLWFMFVHKLVLL